jgi:uncharacterized protein (TIGR02118 family)
MTREAFLAHWHGPHAALARESREVMRVRKYVQNHTITTKTGAAENEVRGGPAEFDGMAEAWFDSLEDVNRLQDSEDARNAMQIFLQDEPNFIDLKNSVFFTVVEHDMYPDG